VVLARAAVAEATLAVARARNVDVSVATPGATRRIAVLRVAPVSGVGRRVVDEVRHVIADRPRAILVRLVITLAISLSLVTFYHFSGWSEYDDVSQLTLYLFSAVVGSVVCTNALCCEAKRVRDSMSRGERLWRIMVDKNLAMAVLVTVAALPVIGFLTVTNDGNPMAMVDQLVTMVFIWLGVGNVLSVLYPLRHEPVSARLRDGTWKPYLFSFALSYGVGLTVNLMIFWRLWSRQAAAAELVGGQWAAFVLVLVSAVTSWLLLTVFAVACSREPRIRRVLSREMVAYRAPRTT
jgi:cytochrome b561